ncbi:uncharacterized protein LOC143301378 [Babylonia areolata]|uniref:uncharacterized protein LOC143301378 n=1 Tax=Babylonia areolata TaxID=304850 RepID=UPI003FCF595E
MLRSFLWMDAHGLAATLTDNLSGGGGGGGGQSRGAASARHVMLRDCALLLRAGLKGGNSVLSKAVILRKTLACLMCLIQMFLMLLVFAPQVGVGGGQGDGAGEGGGYAAVVNANNESVSVPLPVHTFLCRFIVRTRGRDDPFTCSCIMPLAQVYTKALVFLVYLFLVLFLLSALDLTLCAMRLAVPRLKDATLRRFLSLAASQSAGSSASPAHLSAFLDSLGVDGRWLLAVVADCCGVVTAADLTSHLWQAFLESPPKPDQASSVGVPSPAESSGAAARGTRIAEESGGDAAAVPMVTISLQPGDTVASEEEKGGI